MLPKYDLDKIKFATDGPTFEKAVDLYEKGKVSKFEEEVKRVALTKITFAVTLIIMPIAHIYFIRLRSKNNGEWNFIQSLLKNARVM